MSKVEFSVEGADSTIQVIRWLQSTGVLTEVLSTSIGMPCEVLLGTDRASDEMAPSETRLLEEPEKSKDSALAAIGSKESHSNELIPRKMRALESVLLYGIDRGSGTWPLEEERRQQTDSALPILDEDAFFRYLYVPKPGPEMELEDSLVHYTSPILLIGQQGVGKTSLLESVLRRLVSNKSQQTLVVRIRCTLESKRAFESMDSVASLLRDKLLFHVAERGFSFRDLVIRACKASPDLALLIEEADDYIARRLYVDAFEIYDSQPAETRAEYSFQEWLVESLQKRDPVVGVALEEFRVNASLATLVSLYALSAGHEAYVLFAVDNVENLVDLGVVSTAVSYLVRMPLSIGPRGKLVVATRPSSSRYIQISGPAFADRGHNLCKVMDLSDYTSPLPADEVDSSSFVENQEEYSAGTSYVNLFERRFSFIESYAQSDEYMRHLYSGVEQMLTEGANCTRVLAGLSNHSSRTVLVSAMNTVRSAGRMGLLEPPLPYGKRSKADDSDGVLATVPSEELLNLLFWNLGFDGAGIPGLAVHRPSFREAIEQYTKTQILPYSHLVSFYVLRCMSASRLNGNGDGLTLEEIARRLQPLGFDRTDIYHCCAALCLPDEWDQAVLSVEARGKSNVTPRILVGEDCVRFEDRGITISDVLPFRLHYWLGDFAGGRRDSGIQKFRGLQKRDFAQVLEGVFRWSEMEFLLAENVNGKSANRREALEVYRAAANLPNGRSWFCEHVLGSFRGHLSQFVRHLRSGGEDPEAVRLVTNLEEVARDSLTLVSGIGNVYEMHGMALAREALYSGLKRIRRKIQEDE